MGITTKTDKKILSELKLMVHVGATPVECVKALEGKMSRSSVYKYHNKIKSEMDSELTGAFEEVEAVNVPSEIAEEPVSESEQFEEDCKKCDLFYKQTIDEEIYLCGNYIYNVMGYFKEMEIKQEEECDTEAAHIINELSGKNEELQKELHTQKVVIETLQKGVDELNETITESKIMIAKERDEKDEEIRVLNLELQKYKNDIKIVIEDRQKLECLLSDNANETGSIADFREIIEEMIQLYTRKNKDYGNAFKQSYGEFGSVMCAIRINDKLNRFKTLIKQKNEVKTESIKDTLIDLANYAVMAIIEIEREIKNIKGEK